MYTVEDLNLSYTRECIKDVFSYIVDEYQKKTEIRSQENDELFKQSFIELSKRNTDNFIKKFSYIKNNLSHQNKINQEKLNDFYLKLDRLSLLIEAKYIASFIGNKYNITGDNFYIIRNKKHQAITLLEEIKGYEKEDKTELKENIQKIKNAFQDLVMEVSNEILETKFNK